MPLGMKTLSVPTTGQMDEIGPVEGISLRDWFAGQAVANEMVTGDPDAITKDAYMLSVAKDSYAMADAMLEARKG